jgi:hypothetical protein
LTASAGVAPLSSPYMKPEAKAVASAHTVQDLEIAYGGLDSLAVNPGHRAPGVTLSRVDFT